MIALMAVPALGQEPVEKSTETGSSIAVLVAVEFYSSGWAWRPDAIKDTNKIAWILSNHGYEINRVFGQSATSKNIMEAVDKATSRIGEDGNIIFYFSGHGMNPESDPAGDYVVPYGARTGEDGDLISVETIRKEILDYIRTENALFIFDTGSTLGSPNQEFGTILELSTALKQALSGKADRNNNGRVEFSELATHVGPKVKNVRIHARSADEIIINEEAITVISTKIPKKKRKRRRDRERFRPDQFDRLFEQRLEEKMQKLDNLDQKMEEIDQMMDDPSRRMPLPR